MGSGRTGDGTQVTYDGHPLYTYVGDTAPGQVFSPQILSFMRALDTPEVHGYRPDLGYRVYTDKALEIAATARLAPPDPAGPAAAPPAAT